MAILRPGVLVYGHRGTRGRFPENTIAAFEYAIRSGADGIETDLSVTKDGVIVISHDPVHELTAAEAGLPALDDALGLLDRGEFGFDLEIKSDPKHPEYAPAAADFARMALAQIRAHGIENRVFVSSFDFRVLAEMRGLAPEIRLAALIANDGRDFAVVSKAAANAEIVAPQVELVTREKVAAAHAARLGVFAWTANTPEEWSRLIAAGVDGIIADDPAELIAYLRREGLR